MIYLLTAIGLSPGGSTHLHKKYIKQHKKNRTTQITTNVEECGPCPIFASFTLAFALQLRKKQGKTSVRVRKTSGRLRKLSVRVPYTYYQNIECAYEVKKKISVFAIGRYDVYSVFVNISKQFCSGGSSYFKSHAGAETPRNLYDIANGSDYHV
jgi:hypothetical protein